MPKLFSEEIEVICEGKLKEPVCFIWRDKKYKIIKIIDTWQDYGFGAGAPKRKTWRLRRHRNYYRLLADNGKNYEIYLDRKNIFNKKWILYREL